MEEEEEEDSNRILSFHLAWHQGEAIWCRLTNDWRVTPCSETRSHAYRHSIIGQADTYIVTKFGRGMWFVSRKLSDCVCDTALILRIDSLFPETCIEFDNRRAHAPFITNSALSEPKPHDLVAVPLKPFTMTGAISPSSSSPPIIAAETNILRIHHHVREWEPTLLRSPNIPPRIQLRTPLSGSARTSNLNELTHWMTEWLLSST
jgi:hypothetical protein